MTDHNWKIQRLCTDMGDYSLVVEEQKRDWECHQTIEQSWKWMVVYHGSVVASGIAKDTETAQLSAEQNVPA